MSCILRSAYVHFSVSALFMYPEASQNSAHPAISKNEVQSYARHDVFTDSDHLSAAVRHADLELVQQGCGPFRGRGWKLAVHYHPVGHPGHLGRDERRWLRPPLGPVPVHIAEPGAQFPGCIRGPNYYDVAESAGR